MNVPCDPAGRPYPDQLEVTRKEMGGIRDVQVRVWGGGRGTTLYANDMHYFHANFVVHKSSNVPSILNQSRIAEFCDHDIHTRNMDIATGRGDTKGVERREDIQQQQGDQ